MTVGGKFDRVLILLLGAFFMTSSQTVDGNPIAPMRGPHFVLDKVASWVERPGVDAELVLLDGSLWKLKPGTKVYEAQRNLIAAAVQSNTELFVSGDKSRGLVDGLTDTSALAVQQMSDKESNGRYSVLFKGPPSVYYLRIDRPWFSAALSLLRQSMSSGATFSSPDLLVALDHGTSEIMAVRPLDSRKPASQ